MYDTEISKIKPMKDWVLVEVMTKKEATDGGIILPQSSQKLVNYATVLATGPGRLYPDGKWIPNTLKVGDTVYISNMGRCEPIKNEKNRFLMFCAEPFIDGIIDKE